MSRDRERTPWKKYIYIYKLSARFTRPCEPRDQTENDTISNLATLGLRPRLARNYAGSDWSKTYGLLYR